VRPAGADRADQAAAADLISLDRHLERWVVHHRLGLLNPAVVALTHIATEGLLFVLIGVVLAAIWRRPWFLLLLVAADLAADGLSLLLRQWIGPVRPPLLHPRPPPPRPPTHLPRPAAARPHAAQRLVPLRALRVGLRLRDGDRVGLAAAGDAGLRA